MDYHDENHKNKVTNSDMEKDVVPKLQNSEKQASTSGAENH